MHGGRARIVRDLGLRLQRAEGFLAISVIDAALSLMNHGRVVVIYRFATARASLVILNFERDVEAELVLLVRQDLAALLRFLVGILFYKSFSIGNFVWVPTILAFKAAKEAEEVAHLVIVLILIGGLDSVFTYYCLFSSLFVYQVIGLTLYSLE